MFQPDAILQMASPFFLVTFYSSLFETEWFYCQITRVRIKVWNIEI